MIRKVMAKESMPVTLLRDGRGVYGIGVSDLYDRSCEVEPGWDNAFEHPPKALILRPDKFTDATPYDAFPVSAGYAVLQRIAGGFRRGPFMHSCEEHLRQFIHHEALKRAGLPWPPVNSLDVRWWATSKQKQAHNRAIYHGLRRLSLHVINELIDKALHEAAVADAVRAARHFAFAHREAIYRAAALSHLALQLTETFPVLAMAVYSDCRLGELADRKSVAAQLVNSGAGLRDIAAAMKIPMALRHIKPGVAHLATDIFCRHPELLKFLPATTPKQRIWLLVVNWACNRIHEDFGAWAARHVAEIPGRRYQEVGFFISDLADWVCAEGPSRKFVIRPFKSSMSLRTVTTLSAEWHEAVAAARDCSGGTFPPPWYAAAKVGDYDIVPIDNSAALYREGAAMHHCVGTYADIVQQGWQYVYSVRREGRRVATLAIERDATSTNAQLAQLRGPCNAQPSKAIISAVRRWLHAQGPLPAIGTPPLAAVQPPRADVEVTQDSDSDLDARIAAIIAAGPTS